MGDNVLAGRRSYAYYGRSATLKAGDRAVDTHQAFNPMIKSIDFPEDMKYVIERLTTFDKMYHNIVFDKELGEGVVRFRCHFRDPIPAAPFFTYKGVTGSWSASGDQLTYNFSSRADQDANLWVSMHWEDQSGDSNHLDIFLDGGEMISYKIMIEQGQPVIEEFEIKFAEISVGTETVSVAYAPDITDGFDDGSFDVTGVAEITTITTVAASAITTGDYFKIWLADGTGGFVAYYVYFNKAAGGGDPAPAGFTKIEIAITAETDAQIATAVGAALDAAAAGFGTPVVVGTLVTVTQQSTGDIKDAVDVNTDFTIATTTQGVTTIDAGWSLWDGAYIAKTCAMSADCTVSWGGGITDIHITKVEMEFIAPKESRRVASSLTVNGRYLAVRGPWKAIITGLFAKGNINTAQPSTVIASRASGTFKLQYGTTKYFQFTLATIESVSGGGIEAGKAMEGSIQFIGGPASVLTYSWNADEANDPGDHIEHTDL